MPHVNTSSNLFMKTGKILVTIGIIITISGIVFHLQGQSIVGPESSFMYSNPDWITYGIQITIIGIIIITVGTGINFIKKRLDYCTKCDSATNFF